MSYELSHVLSSIDRLYTSKDPQEIQRIQNDLTTVQKLDNGQLASSLLNQSSKNHQYFGALTYTVIINRTQKFDPDTLESLINELQSHIVNSNGMVVKKLLSNLALLFIFNYEQYNNPIERLLSLSTNNTDLQQTIGTIGHSMVSVIIMFSSIVVEELIKKEKLMNIHEAVYESIFKNLRVIYEHYDKGMPEDLELQILDCLTSWITYISLAESQSKVRYNDVESLIDYVFRNFNVKSLETSNDPEYHEVEVINKSITILTDILEINPNMIKGDRKNFLRSMLFEEGNWGQVFISKFISNEELEQEILNVINLIIQFVQLESLSITKNLSLPINKYILNLLIKLTDFPGMAVVEEKVSSQFLTFWDEFFNVFIDNEEIYEHSLDSLQKQVFYNERNDLCNTVCNIYWKKIHLPPLPVLQANKSEFLYFKSNVGDFFSNVYLLLKLPFYESLTQVAISQITNNQLIELESTLFILYKINEDCTFYESQSNSLIPFINQLFSNNLLTAFNSTVENPYILLTFMNYISSVQFYLKTPNGSNYLGYIFDILFTIILKSDLSLSLNASKTIVHICQECKNSLKSFIPNLKPLVIEMIENSNFDNLIRKRMVNSFISIAANELPSSFGKNLLEILNIIENKSLHIMELINNDNLQEDLETIEEYLLSLLGCIEECGKASILSEEVEDIFTDEEINLINKYWQDDKFSIKSKIFTIINEFSLLFTPFINNSSITETCCQILKSGLNEPISGPFKFEISIIFEYIIKKSQYCDALSISYLFRLVETIVITNSNVLNEDTITTLINEIFLDKLSMINSDPDLIGTSIDLFSLILDKKPGILINLPVFKTIVEFGINGLSAKESPIIKSVSKFWVSMLLMKKGSSTDQQLMKSLLITENLGSLLTKTLVVTFLACPRSLLDYYYPIFRQLTGKYSLNFKPWLIDIIKVVNIKIDDKEKEMFVNKLMVTRGHRNANDVLKQFWLNANGLIEFNTRSY